MADYAALLPSLTTTFDTRIKNHISKVQRLPNAALGQCWEVDLAPNTQGYCQVRLHGRKYYVHVIAACLRYGRAPQKGEEASHQCHNRICANPEHLVFEDGATNKSRLCCFLFKDTPGFRCPHSPTCFGAQALASYQPPPLRRFDAVVGDWS